MIYDIIEKLQNTPEAEWVRKMRDFYNKSGYYRAKDLFRLCGNPCRGVSLGSMEKMKKQFLELMV